ncbi:MAG: polysaccharide deacetylase family protein [Flammeovirgaceae bacterium]|nr:polysaccharide deacetylase family protein [Flammeovirgaceae bacterium]
MKNPVKFIIVSTFIILISISCSNEQKENTEIQKAGNWAEKLGFPKGKKVVILHADDVGMCEEANIATFQQLETNVIQSAAGMPPCPKFEEFIDWAKAHPDEDLGLHLTLTSEWKTYRWHSVTDTTEVPGLIDPEGKMWRDVPNVVTHASAEEVEKEVRAQIEKSISLGYRPDHIDTHMGTLFAHPAYVKAFFKVAEEYKIPANVIDLSDSLVVAKFKAAGYPINDEVISLVANYSLPKIDNFTSAPNAKTYDEKIQGFKDLIKSLQPGITEIIFHPSVESENLKNITNSWQQRVWEAKMFSDPDLISFFEQEEIIFTNWKEIMERFNKVPK